MNPREVGAYRKSKSVWAKSAYAIERNPWVSQQDMDEILLYRGTIVAAYGSIETRLADVAIRVSRLDEYRQIREQFPFRTDKRISFLRRVVELGPLAQHAKIANLFLDRFERSSELRHVMAHAFMSLTGDSAGWGVTFHWFKSGDDGGATYREERYTLNQLESFAWRAARLSRLAQKLHYRLSSTGVLSSPLF